MLCKHCQTALTESLAAGQELEAAVRSHLETCAVCREFFAQEQTLFAAIDTRIQQTVNVEMPPSLLPQVRARMTETSVPGSRQIRTWGFAVVAVTIVLAAITSFLLRPRGASLDTPKTDLHANKLDVPNTAKHEEENAASLPRQFASRPMIRSTRQLQRAPYHPDVEIVSQEQLFVRQVLVPPEEREAFAKFVAEMPQEKAVAIALTQPAPEQETELLNFAPVEIAELQVNPLDPTQSR